jgi:hypothetical protein
MLRYGWFIIFNIFSKLVINVNFILALSLFMIFYFVFSFVSFIIYVKVHIGTAIMYFF